MRKYLVFLFLLVGLNPAFTQTQLSQIWNHFLDSESNIVLVAAHRAAHGQYPENSIPAIEKAIELGVDIVELDVKITKDGIPVLMHDRTIDRTTNGTGKPSDYSYAELKKFRLVNDGQITDYYIPTFDEALKLVKNSIMVDIDLKTNQLDPIISVINDNECKEQVFFFDNDYGALEYIRKVDSDFYLMPRAYSYQMADSAISRFSPQVVHIDFSFYNAEVVSLIKSNNARVWINALGEIDTMLGNNRENEALDKVLEFGANIIQTDEPELLLKALRERKRHP